jgi:Zn-finger nucleic acid-binding protein
MAVKELKCPKCGAPISEEKTVCDYCRAHYLITGEKPKIVPEHKETYSERLKREATMPLGVRYFPDDLFNGGSYLCPKCKIPLTYDVKRELPYSCSRCGAVYSEY